MEEPEEPSLLDRIEGLPEEMQNELFNYLEHGEVLRLRRVCNRFRHLAETHLRNRLPNPYLDINFHLDGNHCLAEFKSVRFSEDFIIPKISFFHKDEEDCSQVWKEFLQNPDLDWFMENYAPHVKQLQLESLQLPIFNARQLKFLESFTNLEVFECDDLFLPSLDLWECYFNTEEPLTLPVFVPNAFKPLKRLLIGAVTCTERHGKPGATTKELNRFWVFANEIMKTTVFQEFQDPVVELHDPDEETLKNRMKTLVDVIKSRSKLDKPEKTFYLRSLCIYAICVGSPEDMAIFRPFFEICAESNILFEDVEDTYFHAMMGDEFAKNVKSMVTTDPLDLFVYNYENLEAVDFRMPQVKLFGSGYVFKPARSKPFLSGVLCPKLRGISFQFKDLGGEEGNEHPSWITERLLVYTKRPNLTSLVLKFEEEFTYLVNPMELAGQCANLTYLCIQNLATNSSFFATLFEGLHCLQHLKLSGCPNLDDDSFLADNPQHPPICQLKNLKYLELTDLRRMPRLTDKTLTDAIRHIKLRCFRLMSYGCTLKNDEFDYLLSPHIERFQSVGYSEERVSSSNISLNGIRSLKTGVFAETIEQLDLFGLNIENVPREDMVAVQKEFRSWHF